MTGLLLASTPARRGSGGTTEPPPPGWTYSDLAPLGESGRKIPIPPGYKIWWFDSFNYADRNALLASSFNGASVWTAYSGQDTAYASGYWAQSHVTVQNSLLVLTGSFDTAAHATKYVTGGVGAWGLAGGGNAPAGALWLWCAREEPVGGQPIKTAVMTYGSQYPWAGQFAKNGTTTGSGYAEWPYCGEVDAKEGTQGALSSETFLHWHDPATVTTDNKNGHAQVRVGALDVDASRWHILGYRVDAAGAYEGWTNDNAATDQPLRKWIEQAGANEAFRRAGRAWIYQQEAFGQPAAGTAPAKVYVDWVACLVPIAKGIHTPPGAIIDLHQSKFTLPVDATNGSGTPPKEIFNPQLQTWMHGSFFQANADGTGVVMTANAGGAHTGGSLYARAEERGMNLDSTTEESFGGNDGKTHTRVLTQKIMHLPDHRPEVVCSQIHGDDDDPAVISSSFLLIYASGFWPSTAGSTTYVKGGETAPFKIILKINAMDGSGAVLNVPVLSDIHLGDLFSTKLVMGNNQVLVYMDKGDKGPSGATTLVRTVTTEIPTKGAYFKEGAYNQSNPNNDGEGKKVPNGTAATGGNLTAPIAAGQSTGNATSSEYGQVETLYQKTTHGTAAPVDPPTLNENWAALSGASWIEGSTHGAWNVVFNGPGTVGIESVSGANVLGQTPVAPTGAGDTHASLVVTTASFGDIDLSARMRTVSQTRTGAYSGAVANDWERAWLLWNYTDNTHFYYFHIKTNGWELGKEDPAYPGAQRFLATGSTPTSALGAWNTVRVVQIGASITVFVDGAQVAQITDAERPYTSGKIGLYNEDSHVQFGVVSAGAPAPVTAPPAGVPSDVLTLNGATPWKITLPITSSGSVGNGAGSPLEITLPDLIGYKKDPYYLAQRGSDGVDEVVFYAPSNGATTSGSSNPRTEYREMAGASGTAQAAWATASGTHQLWVVGRVLQLPMVKPQVVLAQIHDAKDDFTFMADGFSPTDSGTAVTGTGTGGFCIVWRDWTGSQQYTEPVIAGVHIGQVYSLMIKVTAGGSVGIYGDLGVVLPGSMTLRKTYAGGNHTACYFKAGAYVQENSLNDGKKVPTNHYTGLPALTSPTPGALIGPAPSGSGGKVAIRQLTYSHA